MSDTFGKPALYAGDQLTPAGEQLVAYLKRRASVLRDDPDVWNHSTMDTERAFYSLVLKDPPVMTAAAWIRQNYDEISGLWLAFLLTLEPEERARAEAGYPPGAPAKESVQPMTARTLVLSEAVISESPAGAKSITSDEALKMARTPEELAIIKDAIRTGKPFQRSNGRIHPYTSHRPPTADDLKSSDTFKTWLQDS